MVPGDPVLTELASMKTAPPQALAALELQYGGTHQSMLQQYLHFWNMLLHGDLGYSLSLGNVPVTHIIAQHMWWTVVLVGLSTVISFVIGTTIGTLAAWKRGSWLEGLLPVTTFIQAMPYFFMATLLVLLFSVRFKFFPSVGGYDFTKDEQSEGRIAYFGNDPTLLAQRSAVAGLIKTKIPFMMSSAELDPPPIAAQSALLKDALCKSEHGCVRSIVLPKHSHMSESYAINTADTQLSDQILEFIKTGK